MANTTKTRLLTVASLADRLLEKIDISALALSNILQTASSLVAADLNLLAGMAAHGEVPQHVAKVALGAANTGGGVFSWQNPLLTNVHITKVLIYVTTVATSTCLIDVGATAASGTTVVDNLLDGIDVHSATGLFDVADQAGANGKTRQTLAAGKWVTGSIQAGGGQDATGLVGYAYIFYVPA